MRRSYIVMGVLMILILVGLGIAGRWWNGVSRKVFVNPAGSYPVKQDAKSPVKSFLEDKTPLNILVLGYGGGKHDGTYLTDSMILFNIDPIKKRITMISIPRDIFVKSGDKFVKINSIYQSGLEANTGAGGIAVKEAVSSVLGIPVNYFLGIDFRGFVNSINILGGVDVKVDVTFDDNQYPVEGKENELCGHDESELKEITATASATREPQLIFPCRYETLHFDAGTVHMDGETALKYVRSRHSAQDGNDFGRSKRQKNLILAVKQKVLALNFLSKAIPFINSLGEDVKTDTSLEEVKMLFQNSGSLTKYQVVNLALTDENYLSFSFSDDGQYILIPKAGQNDYSQIHNWIYGQLNTPVSLLPVVVQVRNGTNIKGLAAKAGDKLKERKIQIVAPINADDKTQTKTKIITYDENIDVKQVNILKEVFGVSEIETATAEPEMNYNVVIILGQDYNN